MTDLCGVYDGCEQCMQLAAAEVYAPGDGWLPACASHTLMWPQSQRRTLSVDANPDSHLLHYRAGSTGLSGVGLRDGEPQWSCTCGRWSLPAVAMSHRATGNNRVEAERGHARHVVQAGGRP